MFADILRTPAVQSLARRLEPGGALPCPGVSPAAQPFFAALLQKLFPNRPIVLVAENLRTQESFQQDLETWLGSSSLFYPAWETMPHEGKLPHADVISDRLQTLVALADNLKFKIKNSKLVVTSVTALLQKTFPPGEIQERTRTFERGSKIAPLDLVEFLEEQGYEPEAQVSQKGEIALRGGIVDVFPPTSPWPVRLEFFGDELESLRHFDPLTQISRGKIASVVLPPAGELGILKQQLERGLQPASPSERKASSDVSARLGNATLKRPEGRAPLATLLDYLPRETICLLCEPEQLTLRADEYAQQVPANDPFFISWNDFLAGLSKRGMTSLEFSEAEVGVQALACSPDRLKPELQPAEPKIGVPIFTSLDAFRPLAERAPELQIAEAQRREFFQQLHRWLRQDYSVHLFCNNEGERERFEEIWKEHGIENPKSKVQSPKSVEHAQPWTLDFGLWTHLGALARGFICDEAKLVVVTDAEIFGRYKIQRPRRQKSSHAQAARSALDIDFTDLEESDYVVHLQHGIGRYLGLKLMPVGNSRHPSTLNSQLSTSTECLVIEYASSDPTQPAPKLYVPVSEAHLVSKYVGAGKANPPLNTLGGTRWHKAKEQAEKAVHDVAAELLRIQAVRETQPGHACKPDSQW